MMKAIKGFMVFMVFGTAAWGQETPHTDTPPTPITCGLYEHPEPPKAWNFVDAPIKPSKRGLCCTFAVRYTPQQCLPDMHKVTEREWQSILARLKALESKTNTTSTAGPGA